MKNIFSLLLLMCSLTALAQQDPIYAQYMNNPLLINPAYAGSNKMFNASLQYRTQWAGLEANPVTANFSSHLSALNNKLGIGLNVNQDQLGDTKNTEVSAAYAYKINLKDAVFSFGLQAGFIRYSNDATQLVVRDAGDPSFNLMTIAKFSMGAGLLLKSDRYIVGLSAPRLLPTSLDQNGQSLELYKQHYYLFGSYVWLLSETIRFKPSLLLRGSAGAPYSVDVNTSLTLKEKFTTGVFTRNLKTYGLLVQANVKSFKMGYVFELPAGTTSSLNFVSHEITLGISMGLFTYHDQALKTY